MSGLNCEFVRPLNKIYKGIIDYFRMDVETREQMSELYRRESEQFEPDKKAKDFKEVQDLKTNKVLNYYIIFKLRIVRSW